MKLPNTAQRFEISILKLFILGLIIRIILMPLTTHGDLLLITWESHYIPLGHLNIYQFFYDNYPKINYNGDVAYLPPIYFIMGIWESILALFGLLDIQNWHNLRDLYNTPSALFLLKMVYLPFDLLAGYFILKLVDEKDRWLAFALWMLNPVVIYVTYVWGQIDVIPAFFMILALYYAKNSAVFKGDSSIDKYAALSVLALGVSACFKNFQLFLIPVFVIVLSGKDIVRFIKLGAIGIVPYALCSLPFLGTPAFVQGVLMAPQDQRLFEMFFDAGGAHRLYVFFILLTLALFYLLHVETRMSFDAIWQYSFVVLSIFYMTTFWHPQWYVWMVPFIILVALRRGWLMNFYLFSMAFFLLYILTWGNINGTGMFHPLAPVVADLIGPQQLSPFYIKLVNMAQSAFAVLSLAAAYSLFKDGPGGSEPVHVQSRRKPLSSTYLYLAAPVVLLVLALMSSFLLGSGTLMGVDQNLSSMTTIEPGIIGNDTVGQVFISPYSNLNKIEVFPTVMGRIKVHDRDVIFHLKSQSSVQDIATVKFNGGMIRDNEPLGISFPAVPDSAGKLYSFILESPDSTADNTFTLLCEEGDIYSGGFAFINGARINADLTFRTYHHMGLGELFASINGAHRDQGYGLFMTMYLLLIAVLTCLLVVLQFFGMPKISPKAGGR
ncbi:MAG TPA: hypothetical protein VN455_11145 [Methanotrichaceae archaeon]|nr:hypothetical protein [Methanotrichaceae archaeon]